MFRAIEQLEPRLTMAVAALTIDAPDSVVYGEQFTVEILARDFDPSAAGFRRVALDLAWNPDVLTLLDSEITNNLPLLRTATLDAAAGTLDDLGGSAMLSSGVGRAIGNLEPERFALLHFQATAEGASSFFMQQGRSRIVTVPVSSLRNSNIDFESHTIHVGIGPLELKHEAIQGNRDGVVFGGANADWGDLSFAFEIGRTKSGHHRLG